MSYHYTSYLDIEDNKRDIFFIDYMVENFSNFINIIDEFNRLLFIVNILIPRAESFLGSDPRRKWMEYFQQISVVNSKQGMYENIKLYHLYDPLNQYLDDYKIEMKIKLDLVRRKTLILNNFKQRYPGCKSIKDLSYLRKFLNPR